MNSGWKECCFSEMLVDGNISYGIVQPGAHKKTDSVPIIRVNNIKDGNINTTDVLKVASTIETKYQRTRLSGGELLITVVGSIGECAIVPQSLSGWNVARAVSVARIKENIDKRFVKYAFRTEDVKFQMYGNTNDTVQPTLNLSSLKEIKFILPSFDEQRAIAGVLSSLDDKIDLLHRQNKTLEGMAEALWREMFVEENKNSRITNLGEIIDICDSRRIPLSSMQRAKMKDGQLYPYYGAATIMDYINQYIFDGEYLLLGEDGTVETDDGYPVLQLATGKFWVNNHTHVLRAKKPYSNYLLYVILKNTSISHIVTGAVQPKINQENLKALEILSAKVDVVEELSVVLNDFWQKIQANNIQVRNLVHLRDTLLPKLISGEVRVTL